MKIILSPAKKMVSDTDSLAPVNVPQHIHILFHAVKNKYNNDSEKLNDRYSKK